MLKMKKFRSAPIFFEDTFFAVTVVKAFTAKRAMTDTFFVSGEITGTHWDTVLVRGAVSIKDAVFESDLILANGLGEKTLDLNNVTIKGRLVVWGGSAVNFTDKSAVAGVVTPRNDGPVQVVFDVAATELSEKGCSIVYPSGMVSTPERFCSFSPKRNVIFRRSAHRCIQPLYTTSLAGLKPVKP